MKELDELLKKVRPLPIHMSLGGESDAASQDDLEVTGKYVDVYYLALAANHLPKLVEALEGVMPLIDPELPSPNAEDGERLTIQAQEALAALRTALTNMNMKQEDKA